MKRIYFLTMLALAICVLSGCSNYSKDYNKNTLIVKRNNSLVEVAVEDFEGMSVSAEDLTSYIDEQIDAYNDKHEKKSVKRASIDTDDMNKAKLVIAYKNIESYNGFNLLDSVLDDLSNVEEAELKGNYKAADGKEVSFEKLSDTEGAKVLVLSQKTDVVVKGEILYYNEQVTVKDGIAACSGNDKAVIIFK
ncbi:MAG: hypothetical protein K2I10_08040 [Lachnospiraceae bacterium]|nr:hypothetical protein [Lachnospiraceae bacterium]